MEGVVGKIEKRLEMDLEYLEKQAQYDPGILMKERGIPATRSLLIAVRAIEEFKQFFELNPGRGVFPLGFQLALEEIATELGV